MIGAALNLWALIREHRKLATLGLVMLAAAGLYIAWQGAQLDKARQAARLQAVIGTADALCADAGSTFRPDGAPQATWGQACRLKISELRAFRRETVSGSLELALAAMEERDGKQAADAALARAMANRTAAAVERMEAADAAVQNDRVGPGWAAAVNGVGGLRDPS